MNLQAPPQPVRPEQLDWLKHWSRENQANVAQRFFSFYRKAVFARTVRHFLSTYFPPSGVFLEAGSGTSETSMRIDKLNGARTLLALDIVLPVLQQCHSIMDMRVCGDIFHLPFREDSLDGIWNVGVMEHFTHDQIDQILREFHRVLRPGGPIVLLWPGVDSIPQKLLRGVEAVVNLGAKGERFRFHPAEISQLESTRQGRDVLSRNGFDVLEIEPGYRSLMAFKVLVGAKR